VSSTSKSAGQWVNARHLEKDGVRTHNLLPKPSKNPLKGGILWDCQRICFDECGNLHGIHIFQDASDIVSARITCEIDYENGTYQKWVDEIIAKEIIEE
jgi:hypothetical protein